jgi:hypothetical protein
MYLHFDDEEDVTPFGEAYGLHFDIYNNEMCLSLNSDDSMTDPFPQLKQPHSYKLVERKRGDHTLPEVINFTVYEEEMEADDGNSFFVPSGKFGKSTLSRSPIADPFPDTMRDELNDSTSVTKKEASKPSIQKGQKSIQDVKGQDQTQTQSVLFSKPDLTDSAKDGKIAEITTLSSAGSDPGASNPDGNTSIFENKSAAPQRGIFPFQDPKSTTTSGPSSAPSSDSSIGPSAGSLFGSAPGPSGLSFGHPSGPLLGTYPGPSPGPSISLPPVPLAQNPEGSKASLPTTLTSPFSISETGGMLATSQVIPPTPASIRSTKRSGTLSEVPKESAPRHIEPVENVKQSSDRLRSNHHANLDKKVSVASPPSKSRMDVFAEWFALGKGGLIDQYTESVVENLLIQTVKKYVSDERKRRAQEEERLSREEAARYRSNFLGNKYFYRWRELAHLLWMRRKGRLARQARRQAAEESFRASRAAEKKDIVHEFTASGNARRQSVESSLISIYSRQSSQEVAAHTLKKSKKRSRLSNSESPRASEDKESETVEKLRQSLLSDSAYLQGGSRIFLLPKPKYSPKTEDRRQPNGVKTDYFRLKARGIMTLPDGSPLANTAAVHLLHHKRSLDDVCKPTTPTKPIKPSASSLPSKPVANGVTPPKTSAERKEHIELLKARAKAVMAEGEERKQSSKKRNLDDDDAELFAKAKRIRDQMGEDIEWMRVEREKTSSRSFS